MDIKLINMLIELKKSPLNSQVDHIELLYQLYWEYSEGNQKLKPLVSYFVHGIDDLPSLKQRPFWNKAKFEEIRKPLIESHSKLIEIVDSILRSL
ncbi:hypothetical protein [Flagellimonas sediminis]|uniref:Uncharacterized protein n=1 Tax=Flagellimonas sediminis TaxID=2696468 RepID=A0A6I5KVM3_9FLAO|nr:hypothetical protein [Allomuricauda sediminis]NDV42098.1 hypothetical protein [Allomuricauda sediminis]